MIIPAVLCLAKVRVRFIDFVDGAIASLLICGALCVSEPMGKTNFEGQDLQQGQDLLRPNMMYTELASWGFRLRSQYPRRLRKSRLSLILLRNL